MGYYMRAFCTSADLPPLDRVINWAAVQGTSLQVEKEPTGSRGGTVWREADIRYKPDREPIVVDASRAGVDDGIAGEVEEFIEMVEDADNWLAKRRVVRHLRKTRTIVGAQLLGDLDEDGQDAVAVFLGFFVEHCGALIQDDGSGFWKGDDLVLALD